MIVSRSFQAARSTKSQYGAEAECGAFFKTHIPEDLDGVRAPRRVGMLDVSEAIDFSWKPVEFSKTTCADANSPGSISVLTIFFSVLGPER